MTLKPLLQTKADQLCERDDIEGAKILKELALNLRWSWSHMADRVWERLDPGLWELTHNPWVVLQTVSQSKLKEALADPEFCTLVHHLVTMNREEAKAKKWFQDSYPDSKLTCAAYFSMEFMITEALPIYSGGLGNVAGDQLKAASDLGVPVCAVGLLYQRGYFRQMLDKFGAQQALFPYNDPGQLPISPLRKENGEWLRLEVSLPGYSLWVRTWQVQIGRIKLLLLDSNDAANFPAHRGITSELYGGDSELRIKQEMLLGIGGWRLLETLGLNPEVCHLNEGHAAFAVLERAASFMQKTGLPFDAALAATRAGNLFTTHTAVPAGFDRFSPELMEQYLSRYCKDKLKIPMNELLALGRSNPNDPHEPFNMAYLAIRGSGAVNGVSELHGKVSRHIFEPIFPRWPDDEIPVAAVTNGVHMPSWDSSQADEIWTGACGKQRWLGCMDQMENHVQAIPKEKLWEMRNIERRTLVQFARKRLVRQLEVRGAAPEEVEIAREIFDPNTLTLGFARRFATYKRPNMLLQDPERLIRILTNPQRPVQLIIAGKAHPADLPGQALIKQWSDFIHRPEVRPHVIFISDYDMHVTEQLVQGVDVWVNTPRRPWEACGTSGMKVLVNGGLNLSELDGWWAEAYTPEVGWAIGDGQEHDGDPSWDAAEARTLYDILENEVIPCFYNRDAKGVPDKWVEKIRESMSKLTPRFSANRSVREYTDRFYVPAAKAVREREVDKGKKGKEIVEWRRLLDKKWQILRFVQVSYKTVSDKHEFNVQIYLDDLDPKFVKVQLYSNGNGTPEVVDLELSEKLMGDTYQYRGSVSADKHPNEYTPRVIPYFHGVNVPLEENRILWQR